MALWLNLHITSPKFIIQKLARNKTCLAKHLSILVPAPFLHLICINFLYGADYTLFLRYLGQICIQSCANFASKFEKFTNLVRNINTEALKKAPFLLPN